MKRSHLAFLLFSLLCLILAACGGTSSTTATTTSKTTIETSTTTTSETTTEGQSIKVTIGDFYIHSPVTTFTTGTKYQFVITNVGTHYHNFLIMHPMDTMIATVDIYKQALGFVFNVGPNQTKVLSFTFDHTAPSGMLELSCHYGGHYEAGMHQSIVVNAAPGASVSPYPNNGIPPAANAQTDGTCDPVVTTKIVNGAYTPANLPLKSGDTLEIINTDSQSNTPTTPPGAGVRFINGGPSTTQYITFLFAGTFPLSIQQHPEAKATVSVSKMVGTTCEMTPVTTVSFTANYANPKNPFLFAPTQLTIKKGQSIRLTNLVDQNLTFTSNPDAALGNVKISKDWDADLKFTAEGTYTISCVQIPNQKFTVTVQSA